MRCTVFSGCALHNAHCLLPVKAQWASEYSWTLLQAGSRYACAQALDACSQVTPERNCSANVARLWAEPQLLSTCAALQVHGPWLQVCGLLQ